MNNAVPAYTHRHWAKSDASTRPPIHFLNHHLADVCACFEALLKQPAIRNRLARVGGKRVLDTATAARLCVLAALHDVGKVNTGFQAQIWRARDLPPQPQKPHRMGHVQDFAPVGFPAHAGINPQRLTSFGVIAVWSSWLSSASVSPANRTAPDPCFEASFTPGVSTIHTVSSGRRAGSATSPNVLPVLTAKR